MQLTDAQSRWLAEFCGGTIHDNVLSKTLYTFPEAGMSIPSYLFDPLHDWNHLKLVMEALVKAVAKDLGMSAEYAWEETLIILKNMASEQGKRFDFPTAICTAALALKGK